VTRHREIFARDPQDLIRAEDRGALKHVLQFTDIPHPWILDKRVNRFGRDRVDGFSKAAAELLHVVADQWRNIFRAFAQRRDAEREQCPKY